MEIAVEEKGREYEGKGDTCFVTGSGGDCASALCGKNEPLAGRYYSG